MVDTTAMIAHCLMSMWMVMVLSLRLIMVLCPWLLVVICTHNRVMRIQYKGNILNKIIIIMMRG